MVKNYMYEGVCGLKSLSEWSKKIYIYSKLSRHQLLQVLVVTKKKVVCNLTSLGLYIS